MQDRFAPSPGGDLSGSGKRVLIVEDEPIIAFALEDALTELGHIVLAVAGTVDQSLKLIEETEPEIVILDVNLHGTDSYPVADALEDRGVHYVFATGYGDAQHPERHREVPTLTKPYSVREVKDALAKLCS